MSSLQGTYQRYSIDMRLLFQKLYNIAMLHPGRNEADPRPITVEMKYTIKRQDIRIRKLSPCHNLCRELL